MQFCLVANNIIIKWVFCICISTDSLVFWEAEIHRDICLSPSLSGCFDLCLGKSNTASSPFTIWKWTRLCSILYMQNNPPLRDSICSCWYFTSSVILQDWGVSFPKKIFCSFSGSSSFPLLEDWSFVFYCTWRGVFHSAVLSPTSVFMEAFFFFSEPWNLHLFFLAWENMFLSSILSNVF